MTATKEKLTLQQIAMAKGIKQICESVMNNDLMTFDQKMSKKCEIKKAVYTFSLELMHEGVSEAMAKEWRAIAGFKI